MIDVPAVPPITWFRDPGLDELTPLTVTTEGRVLGHIAGWGTKHASFPGRNITPPRSRSDYSYFMVGALNVLDGDQRREISVGHLALGSGHAGTSLNYEAAADFYDNAASVAADVCVGEDEHGIWFSGCLAHDMDELRLRRFKSCALSGDWRHVEGFGLELTAVLSVVTPGFPIPRARVASGSPLALVAAGAVAPARGLAAFTRRIPAGWTPKTKTDRFSLTSFSPAHLADMVADRLDRRRRDAELAATQSALVGDLDDTAVLTASLLESVDDTAAREAALLADLDDTSSTLEALNWVDDAGGLPDYIKRITKHLQEKGMDESQAIATAVNAAKKMCATGDLNFPGSQQVNPGSKAEACAAVADWEAKKAKSKAA
jgi:hypothetical protein